jgi:tRNA pseudouridine55 synthase
VDGFFLVNKPVGPSSFAIIHQLKPFVLRERIGHAGTLDPAASGLLIVAVGNATRLLQYLPAEPKAYTFIVQFGSETDTLDNEGIVIESGGRVPCQEELEPILSRFIGRVHQEPPRFSAIKIDGERAYARARNNESFAMTPREVTITSLTLENFNGVNGSGTIVTKCSSGTYVRALARDIARNLGTLGFASAIRRTAIGPFSLDGAQSVDDIAKAIDTSLVSIREAFKTCACVTVSEAQKKTLSFGADIRLDSKSAPEEDLPLFAFDDKDEIVAVLIKKENEVYHPEKVFL